ncbi:MAG: hypothetical protein WD894_14950 [Pirellulales bacterium]
MKTFITRRSALKSAGIAGAAFGLNGLGFLSQLQPLSAAETKLPDGSVQFHPEIEPLVRLLEETPRDRILEEVAGRIKRGTSYREILAALFLAGIRNVQPRPSVGFKFHAVLVVNSAHIASMDSPDEHRWLPIFWAIDHFKSAQGQDQREGNWTMSAVDESRVPSPEKARQGFVEAMEAWDEPQADAAAAGLARAAGSQDVYELLFRYGVRDFRSIGHKAIYVANSWRTLAAIGGEHAEPIVRSLAYALLMRDGQRGDDLPAERPWKRNLELAARFPANWRDGKTDDAATIELLTTIRNQGDQEASQNVASLLERGVGPQSIWDALFLAAGELLVRQPDIAALHAVTSTNAIRFAFDTAADDHSRRMLLLQNAAFLPLFRRASAMQNKDFQIDKLEPVALDKGAGQNNEAAFEELFGTISGNRMQAAGKVMAYLQAQPNAKPFIDAARVLVFRKGDDSHDYKFSSAVLEDYRRVSPQWRNRYLAASVFKLQGTGQADNMVVERTRAALA